VIMTRWRLPALVVALLIVAAAVLYSRSFLTPPTPTKCNSDTLDHVYNPDRLEVLNACQSVSGIVENVIQEADGDAHIRLLVDQGYENLLNQANYDSQYGTLVLEVICVYPVTQADAVSACSDYTNTITLPSVNANITVWGQYVTDLDHGWNEIHPVFSIQQNS
jgi:hypothetical protein